MSIPTPKTLSILALALLCVIGFAPMRTADAATWMPIFEEDLLVASVDLGDGTLWIQPAADKAALESRTGETATVGALRDALANLSAVGLVRIDGHFFLGLPKIRLDNQGFTVHSVGDADLAGYDHGSYYTRP